MVWHVVDAICRKRSLHDLIPSYGYSEVFHAKDYRYRSQPVCKLGEGLS